MNESSSEKSFSSDEFADEGDWYASLVAGERVGEWLDVIESAVEEKEEEDFLDASSSSESLLKKAISNLTLKVREDETYGEEAEVAEAERRVREALEKVRARKCEKKKEEKDPQEDVSILLEKSVDALETYRKKKKSAKTDRIDAQKLAGCLVRYWRGDESVFSVVRVPPREVEDVRTLERERKQLGDDVRLRARWLHHLHPQGDIATQMDCLGPDSADELLTGLCRSGTGNRNALPLPGHEHAGLTLGQHARCHIHRRRSDEACDKKIGRAIIELQRLAHLLDNAVMHDHDLVGHGHGLDLVVGHVDHRGVQLALQLGRCSRLPRRP